MAFVRHGGWDRAAGWPLRLRRSCRSLVALSVCASSGCAAVSGLDDLVFDVPSGAGGTGGSGGSSTGTGGTTPTGTGAGGTPTASGGSGGSGAGIVELTGSLQLPDQGPLLAAFGGAAFVGAQSPPALWRVGFPSAAAQALTLPASTDLLYLNALVADAVGVVWGGMRDNSSLPPTVDAGAVGGSAHDGSDAWLILETYPSGTFGGEHVREVTADEDYVWATGNNSEAFRLERACSGTGASCGTILLRAMSYATLERCLARTSDSQYLFRGQYASVYGGTGALVERIDAGAAAPNGEWFATVAWTHYNRASCAVYGSSVFWNDYGYDADKIFMCPVDAPVPCEGQIAWAAEPGVEGPLELLVDGGDALFFVALETGGYSIRRLAAPLEPAEVVVADLAEVEALAVDTEAVYWLEASAGGLRLRAVAR